MKDLKQYILALAKKAAEATDPHEASLFAQAAATVASAATNYDYLEGRTEETGNEI